MGIYKNTSVALTIGLMELTAQARQISDATFQTFTAFGAATLIYLALALIAYQTMMLIDRAVRIPGTAPGKEAVGSDFDDVELESSLPGSMEVVK